MQHQPVLHEGGDKDIQAIVQFAGPAEDTFGSGGRGHAVIDVDRQTGFPGQQAFQPAAVPQGPSPLARVGGQRQPDSGQPAPCRLGHVFERERQFAGRHTDRILGILQANPNIDGILTLNVVPGMSALQAVADVGREGEVMVGTADLSNEALEAIGDGRSAFAMYQQPLIQDSMSMQIAARRWTPSPPFC